MSVSVIQIKHITIRRVDKLQIATEHICGAWMRFAGLEPRDICTAAEALRMPDLCVTSIIAVFNCVLVTRPAGRGLAAMQGCKLPRGCRGCADAMQKAADAMQRAAAVVQRDVDAMQRLLMLTY